MNDQKLIRDEKLERAKNRLKKSYKRIEEQKYNNSIIFINDEPTQKFKYKLVKRE